MQMIAKAKKVLSDPDQTKSFLNSVKNFLVNLLRAAILIGVGYVILSPVIGIIVNSISSNKDAYNPMVFVLPQFPTLERYALAIERLNYFPTMFRDLLYTL
ncbi:MAG: carbohydrate ABC transporter permease, partial [Lachnospiraceae bacterium]|nr:carbohydrate ABC transporter permease [Lachnospiraceae bacterium]